MEIPRHWREQPTNMRFEGLRKEIIDQKKARQIYEAMGVAVPKLDVFKYPGGEILLDGSYEQIRERFQRKGFSQEATDDILFRLWGGISAESSVSVAEVADSFFELIGSEVGK